LSILQLNQEYRLPSINGILNGKGRPKTTFTILNMKKLNQILGQLVIGLITRF